MIRAVLAIGCVAALSAGVLVQPSPSALEDAYRANNLGVARLEQFDYPAAAAAFRQALDKQADLSVARLNLAIALFYAGELGAARREAEAAAARLPSLPQPPYVLGLIARAENRTADAVTAFTRVRELDPDDPGAATQLGQLLLQERKYAEAADLFRGAIKAEPYNATAAYGLAMALTRAGSRDEGATAMAQFQKLRDSAYGTTYSQNYLEQGRYAEAISSTGAEPHLVDETAPKVTFTDVTATVLPEARKAGSASAAAEGTVTLVDLDGDGDLDLIDVDPRGLRLFRNHRGQFTDRTAGATFGTGTPRRVVAGDYDNDFLSDLLVLYDERWAIFRQEKDRFKEVAGLPAGPASPRTAAWLDADHDGDLDALVGGSAAGTRGSLLLARNNGDGTFADITAAAGLTLQTTVLAVAPTDYDLRRDIDIVVLSQNASPMLLRNMRDGTFRDVTGETGLLAHRSDEAQLGRSNPGGLGRTDPGGRTDPAGFSPSHPLTLGDINKDSYPDVVFVGPAGSNRALSDGRGHYGTQPVETGSLARAVQLIDYDNDGLLDLFALTAGPRISRNLGARWGDVTDQPFDGVKVPRDVAASIAAGDLDQDGDTDVVLRYATGGPIVLRNDGGNRNRSLRVRLTARVSNRSALGSKVEIRAGSLRQKLEMSAASPAVAPADLIVGMGARQNADVVRVLWPAGILQAETPPSNEIALTVHELDRKPSSCPYLYTWNGERFEFVTDFLGGGELGYYVAPGVRNRPDPDEYVRIDGRQLRERDGRYELRVTNELEETLFLDRTQLVVITHPDANEVYPQEGMRAAPPPFALHTTRDAAPPLAAVDDHGHDVLDRVARLDRRYPDDFALERIRGYARPHSLTLRLPESRPANSVLLLTGWTDYAFSSDNFAASQAGLKLEPPTLEVKDEHGRWRTAIPDVGIPVGRPQTIVVDLSKAVPPSVREVRLSTTMRIYWDQIRVAASVHPEHLGHLEHPHSKHQGHLRHPVHLDPVQAELRWRGFSAEATVDEPYRYDYARVSPLSPWKLMPGRYTREGDVRPLLTAVDDMFVVARPGDEIALSFDARALPPLPRGSTRTFLLYADGFSKEMNLHSSSPDVVEPLPFHGMPDYPYAPPHDYPRDAAHREYLERYNTRIVRRMLPLLVGESPVP
jgi:tetratricopeptide (TPR) repeat protein